MEERSERNAIFGSSHTPGLAQQVQQPSIRSSIGMDLPTELVPLPTLGKVYGQNSFLHLKDSIEIRPMTTREEDILTNRALIKTGKVITTLIKSCIVDPNVNVQEMVASDRNAIMTAIRITGYGSEYSGELQCSDCGAKYNHEFDLSKLPIKFLDIEPVSPGMNEFEFFLPFSKKRVTFKFLTGRDEEDIMARQEALKKKSMSGQENLITTRLLYSLVSVEGLSDRSQIAAFINNMPARDSLALRKYIDKHEPGIEMKQSASCTSCGYTEEVTVPMGISFFWPST